MAARTLVSAGLLLLAAGAAAAEFETAKARVRVVEIATGLEHPWGLAFLPDGRMLVTERPGRLRVVGQDGRVSAPVAGVPPVLAIGQGGLLDVALDPDFPDNRWIYLSYAEDRGAGTNATAVARARLAATGLTEPEVIFRQQPAVESQAHFGGRLAFGRDHRLFVTLGERSARHFIDRAQSLADHFGKVVRIERDGGIPPDNPFLRHADARPEIWSLGHRNPQGAALHPETGELWISEHGPRGGDELNVVRAGSNHGWPVITYGVAYSGDPIGIGTHQEGMEQPVHHWVPSIATSGLAFQTSDRIPGWNGSVFVGGLAGKVLVRLELDGEQVVHEERLLGALKERIRDVRQGPDGFLYLLTDSPQGRLLRVEPAANEE
ncbi:MAG TPA: PQQ-dependent sugar dehydrogenase [Steroidobacteraceae bacterium]|nr:PQQ-dependent sugar dehydrogenase [Steroidobacteraceae bacterium]